MIIAHVSYHLVAYHPAFLPCLSSISFIYIRCCNQRHKKFFLPKENMKNTKKCPYQRCNEFPPKRKRWCEGRHLLQVKKSQLVVVVTVAVIVVVIIVVVPLLSSPTTQCLCFLRRHCRCLRHPTSAASAVDVVSVSAAVATCQPPWPWS
jgi:hypothetical protein